MNFDYDEMPRRNKEHSNGKIMRECNNCGERTYMLYEEDRNYRVICENCEEDHAFKANSMDEAMEKWEKMELEAGCEYCPLGWEDTDYVGECNDCGCFVYEDIKWCKKTYAGRAKKAKEFEY